MKAKELKDLRTKEKSELLKMVRSAKMELINLTGKMYAGKEKNLKKTRNMRKEIAQLLTIAKEMKEVKKK
ncbi:MAG TPA: 50S ribosomal protein L29 [Patescibacteria group bacterium]|nr:50S ribosomal protein L29 [Patescibacteria group bacterium]